MRVRKQHRQDGVASFMVTTVMILVISLTVIGFSLVARRNQSEALDRQLTAQAFYAAESGVNAAISVIQDHATSGSLPPEKTECNQAGTPYPNPELNGEEVKVSCLLVTTGVSSLVYDGVTESTPKVVPVISEGGAPPIGRLVITWRSPTGGAAPASNCKASTTLESSLTFPRRSNWNCGFGTLRVDVAEKPTGSDAVAATAFLYPTRYTGALSAASANQVGLSSGELVTHGYCVNGADPKCMTVITGLSQTEYYLNLRSIYHDSNVVVEAQEADGTPIGLTGQIVIDSTGKAQDVLRRIQVRVPLLPRAGSLPGYAIESSNSVCKRYAVNQNGFYATDGATCP